MVNLDLIARQVLMSAYLCYHRNENVLTDHENDELCKILVNNWQDVPDRYKPLLDPNGTRGECLYHSTFQCKWTRLVEGGAIAWLRSKGRGADIHPYPYDHLAPGFVGETL